MKHLYLEKSISAISNWFCNTHIQIYGFKKHSDINFLNLNDWIHSFEYKYKYEFSFQNKYDDIITIIKDMLDNGYFVYAIIDDYHIKMRKSHKVFHDFREVFVVDFNSSNDSFKILGYTDSGRYDFKEIPVREFYNALLDKLYFIMPKTMCSVSLDTIKSQINEYIHPIKNDEFTHGIDTIIAFKDKISLANAPNELQDLRHFYFLWEHKQSMLEILSFLHRYKVVSEADLKLYSNVCSCAKTLLNLRENLNFFDDSLKLKMVFLLDQIIETENTVLSNVSKSL